MPTPTKSGRLM